jgi:hypothetical protein
MADESIVRYIREQLSAGYTEGEIRDALSGQGWHPEEIEKAFSDATSSEQEEPDIPVQGRPAEGKSGNGMVFILPLAGGVLVILNSLIAYLGIGDLMGIFVHGIKLSVLGMLGIYLSSFSSFLVNVMIGGLLVAAAFIMHFIPGSSRLTGVFILALSLITLLMGDGLIIGGAVAIIGGFLAIIGR